MQLLNRIVCGIALSVAVARGKEKQSTKRINTLPGHIKGRHVILRIQFRSQSRLRFFCPYPHI